ncbi:MAG: FtsQ-type POTRA domain-containing protein [Melioribacteraceae bacterium]
MKNLGKILSAAFLIISLGGLLYLAAGTRSGHGDKIKTIAVEGEYHLTKEQYLNFANLSDESSYQNLRLQIIKDRIEKHPYVQNADVRFDGAGKVLIKITEKVFDSILIADSSQYLLTEGLQLLPMLPDTKKIDYPVISNAFFGSRPKILSNLRKNLDIVTASKIISAVRMTNPELGNDFSSIDLQNGGEILFYLSSTDYPVMIGRGNEIKKVIYFNTLWQSIKGKEINNFLDYVDLRYGGHVYLGITDSTNGLVKNLDAGQKKS